MLCSSNRIAVEQTEALFKEKKIKKTLANGQIKVLFYLVLDSLP
jgi:hypothetical protein